MRTATKGEAAHIDSMLGNRPAFIEAEVYARLEADLDQAEAKAWESLARYKFQMFGYWAAIWVHLNRVGKFRRPNPWKHLVDVARGPIRNERR